MWQKIESDLPPSRLTVLPTADAYNHTVIGGIYFVPGGGESEFLLHLEGSLTEDPILRYTIDNQERVSQKFLRRTGSAGISPPAVVMVDSTLTLTADRFGICPKWVIQLILLPPRSFYSGGKVENRHRILRHLWRRLRRLAPNVSESDAGWACQVALFCLPGQDGNSPCFRKLGPNARRYGLHAEDLYQLTYFDEKTRRQLAQLATALIYAMTLDRRFKRSLAGNVRDRQPAGPLKNGNKVCMFSSVKVLVPIGDSRSQGPYAVDTKRLCLSGLDDGMWQQLRGRSTRPSVRENYSKSLRISRY